MSENEVLSAKNVGQPYLYMALLTSPTLKTVIVGFSSPITKKEKKVQRVLEEVCQNIEKTNKMVIYTAQI